MIRKISFIVVIMVCLGKIVAAQSAEDGFKLLNQKDFNAAKKVFASLLKTDPKNPAAHYGMGEYYFYTGKTDSATVFYQSGLDANSSYAYNYVGLGKVNAGKDPVVAENFFKDAIKKSKKDAGAIVAIAKFYYEQTPKKLVEARRYTDQAILIDAKNAPAYFMDGLIDIAESKASDAALNFDRAIFFDPSQLDAYIYASQIMVSTRNIPKAVEYLNNALAVKPDFWLAYKSLGELYYNNQNYPESVKAFGTYFKNVPQDQDVTHYAYSLFFNKQYQEARDLLDKLIQKNPNDYILLRLLGYISFETNDLANGKAVMEKYFSLVPQDKILNDDYSYYGKMLSASGQDSLAIESYKKGLAKDSTDFQLYDEIAKSYKQLKQYDLALDYSAKFLDKKPNKTTVDYFNLGKAYYVTANSLRPDSIPTDSIKQLEYLQMSDSLFSQVETYSPTSYLGPFWRARVNSAIDKETTLGLAKPFYEKALEILIKDPVKYKKDISEIYSYLGFYYYVKEDNAASIDYWKKVLELNPENQKALEAINALEKKK